MTVRRLVDWQSPNKPIPFLFPVMRDAMLGVVFWEGHVVDSSQERADGSLLLSLSKDLHTAPDVVAAAVTVSCSTSAGDVWCAIEIGLIDASGWMYPFAGSTVISVGHVWPNA